MKFEFESVKKDYSDFSSDKVLVNAPRTPAFPVRIASEIMARCLTLINTDNSITLYDPCCGGGHLLAVVGLLYSAYLTKIYGTDIDEQALKYAQKNLNLLTPEGFSQRKKEIQYNYEKQEKQPQLEALNSAERLETMLLNTEHRKKDVQCFQWDITGEHPPFFKNVNVVIADLPYGNMTYWQGIAQKDPNERLLNNIYQTLDVNNAIVVLVCNKQERISHKKFEQVKRLKHGKRQFIFFRPLPFYTAQVK